MAMFKSAGTLSTFNAEYPFKCITAILVTKANGLIISGDDKILLLSQDREEIEKIHYVTYSVPDMTWVRENIFAFIDKGKWFYSDVYLMKIDNKRVMQKFKFSTEKNCEAIFFHGSCFFLSFSGQPGFVKIVDERGEFVARIKNDASGKSIFSDCSPSKLFFDDISQLFVCHQLSTTDGKVMTKIQLNEKFEVLFYNFVYNSGGVVTSNLCEPDRERIVFVVYDGKRSSMKVLDKGSLDVANVSGLKNLSKVTAICFHNNEILLALKKSRVTSEIAVYRFEGSSVHSLSYI